MNNKRATKRALLTSVMALVMCVVMLVGTTFAWFTDTASTGVNKIQAGNLKMEVTYKNTSDREFNTLNESTNVFMENAHWEPGHVEFAVLNVKNIGTLALKYKLGINIASETGSTNVYSNDFMLSDYIKFAVIDGDKSGLDRDALVAEAGAGTVLNAGYTDEDHLVPVGKETSEDVSSKTVTLVVWMPKSVGNEANYKVAEGITAPSIDLGISVAATQYTYEEDSFDKTYDKNAQYPEVSYAQVSSQDDLNNALTNPTDANGNPTTKVAVELKNAGTYTLPSLASKDVTIIGTKDTVVDVSTGAAHHGATIALEGVTVKGQTSGNFEGLMHTKKVTYKDCTITGKQTLYANDVEFINCAFENQNDYCIWTWGAKNVTFEGCTFNTNGKAINLYGGAGSAETPTTVLTVNNCIFNDSNNGATGKAAIEVGNDYGATYILTVNNVTVNGFAVNTEGENTDSRIWANKKSMDAAHLSVTIDGNKVH